MPATVPALGIQRGAKHTWSLSSLNLHSSEEDRQSVNTLLSNALGVLRGFEEN